MNSLASFYPVRLRHLLPRVIARHRKKKKWPARGLTNIVKIKIMTVLAKFPNNPVPIAGILGGLFRNNDDYPCNLAGLEKYGKPLKIE